MVNISEDRQPIRRQERRLGQRKGISKIARAAFLSDGYAGTSMSTIASRLGGSKGTLYTYFKSKENLFQAVLDDMLEQHTAFLAMDMAVGEPEKVLTKFCTQLVSVVLSEEGRALDRIVSGESNRFPEIGKALYDRARASVKRNLLSICGRPPRSVPCVSLIRNSRPIS